MKFEAVLLDLDGTILRPDQIISDDVSAAISNIRDRIPVCILTGRELAEVLDYASILRLTSPQACDGGSTIVSASSKKVLWAVSLSNYEICLILDELKTSRLSFLALALTELTLILIQVLMKKNLIGSAATGMRRRITDIQGSRP